MKITIIHGQNHKGSTYHIAKILADKLGGEIKEFFLPRDFNQFCIGCTTCIMKDEKMCPHYEMLKPLTDAIDDADVLIFASPVYVFHVTGPMKAFLDHYAYRWMLHRPEKSMFNKQAVCISTAAGGGMRSTNKDMADSLFYWGLAKTYRFGMAVTATSFENVNEKKKETIERKMSALAKKITKNEGHVKPGIKTRALFFILHLVHRNERSKADSEYWKKQGWTGNVRPWL